MKPRIMLLALTGLLVIPCSAAAQVQWGLSAWSAGVGFAAPDNLDNTFWLDAGLEFVEFAPGFTGDGRLLYWGSSTGSGDLKADFSDIALLPGVTYRFAGRRGFSPLLRGGLGFHRFKGESKLNLGPPFGVITSTDTNTEFGAYVGGGGAFRVSDRFEVLAVAEMHFMDENFFVIGAEFRVPFTTGGTTGR